MRNLLAANFFRLRKSALFWGLLAFSAGFGALIAFNYYEMSRMEPIALDGAFFVYPLTASVLTAVFVPLFFGRDYSDRAIRNKVAAGRSGPFLRFSTPCCPPPRPSSLPAGRRRTHTGWRCSPPLSLPCPPESAFSCSAEKI